MNSKLKNWCGAALLAALTLFVSCVLAPNVRAQTGGTLQGFVLPSLSRSATTVTSADQLNIQWRGGHFVINVSEWDQGAYTPHIQGKDPVSGNYYDLLVGTAINSTSTTVLKLYPGILAIPNASASDTLPRTWRVQMSGTTTPVTMTFSVGIFLEQ